jgi:hypothetical protein
MAAMSLWTRSLPFFALLVGACASQPARRPLLATHGDEARNAAPPLASPVDLAAARATSAASYAPQDAAGEMSEEEKIAEAIANPLSYLWLLFMQNDTFSYDGDALDGLGESAKTQNVFLINPVLSLQLTQKWKMIFRPVIPINSFNTVDNVTVSAGNPSTPIGVDFERETGLGDIVLWTAFSKQYEPPFVWGVGPTIMLDTASDEQLGTGKYSAGPMGMAFSITEKWILGVIGQHWWSFSDDDGLTVTTPGGPVTVDRADVNLSDLQYVVRYRLSNKTNIGAAPNIRYNWETDQLNLPIGIGADSLFKFGPLPVKIGIEAYYYVENNEDVGPEWQLRVFFVPVIPSPEWARRPLF